MSELAKAYVQIIPTADGIQGKLEGLLGDEGEKAGKSGGERASGAFGKALGAIGKIGAAAIGAAMTGIGALTKSAVEGYADFEQLAGGVDTLFKRHTESLEAFAASTGKSYASMEEAEADFADANAATDMVMRNAQNAYKTAGLSANEYMETVTSMSAALLQSLEGDTMRAAEAADMAITDMSDNANKMGTSMESIQNAYNGFSKGTFTMLDNLKLGYGGTKEEMERLLQDAQKISGVKYDISSYADIVDAIHVVQTEMGITGTTAREAGSTITGSLGMLKSSWTNLVAGFANPDANIGVLISNVVDSATTAIDNLLPAVTTALGGIAAGIEKFAPIIADLLPGFVTTLLPALLSAATTLVNALAAALPDILRVVIDIAPGIITSMIDTVLELMPEIVALGLDLLLALANGIAESLPELVPTIIDVMLEIVDTLTDPETLSNLIDAAIAIVIALANGLINALPELLGKAPEIIANLVTAIIENVPKLVEAAFSIVGRLVMGIIENLPEIGKAAGRIISTLLTGLEQLWEKMLEIGRNVVEGIWEGIKGMGEWLWQQVSGFFSGIVGGIKDFLGIHSPSTVFAGIGENMASGIGIGFERTMDKVERDILDAVQIPETEFSVGDTLLHTAKIPITTAALPYADGQNGTRTDGARDGNDELIAVVSDGFARILQELQSGGNMDMNRFARALYPYMTQAGRQRGASLVTGGGI